MKTFKKVLCLLLAVAIVTSIQPAKISKAAYPKVKVSCVSNYKGVITKIVLRITNKSNKTIKVDKLLTANGYITDDVFEGRSGRFEFKSSTNTKIKKGKSKSIVFKSTESSPGSFDDSVCYYLTINDEFYNFYPSTKDGYYE